MKTAGKMELTLADWTEALEASLSGIIMRGKAELGDKTMVDALTPAVNALKQAIQENQPINTALELSAEAAKKAWRPQFHLLRAKDAPVIWANAALVIRIQEQPPPI